MELKILYLIQKMHTPILDKIMTDISSLGNAGVIWIVLIGIQFCFPQYRKSGMTMGMALIIDGIICNLVLKNMIARPRPCWVDPNISLLIATPKDFSFPSGHTAAAFAAVVPLMYYHRTEGMIVLVFALLMAFSRMYLFVHYPTDILGGILVGSISGIAAIYIIKTGIAAFEMIKK